MADVGDSSEVDDSSEVRAGEDRKGEGRAVEVRAGEVRSGEVRAIQTDRLAVVSDGSAANDSEGRLYVRTCCAPRGFRSCFMDSWRGPLLGGVVADEFGQHFHHRGVVASRVVGDAF